MNTVTFDKLCSLAYFDQNEIFVNRLPDILLYIGRLSPATYAASTLRQTLLEPITGQLVVDLTALVGFSLLTFWWVGLKLDWRQR
ncbi:hypothetical protein [Scytonema sp. PCC 10023]|uniref:hypothetical protein n=1 Tax=Scytonema sp. PCC 10023 TaxID=1680591 RepID=UPI0039C6516D